MLTNEKKRKITYTQGIFYFEVKFMETSMYAYSKYLMICIQIELS